MLSAVACDKQRSLNSHVKIISDFGSRWVCVFSDSAKCRCFPGSYGVYEMLYSFIRFLSLNKCSQNLEDLEKL